MSEILDIANSFNIITHQESRDEAHKIGLWHRTVNFLLIDSSNQTILFQNKKNKEINDDFFLQVNGGHLQAGESIEEGKRELEEETGISLDKVKFTLAGVVPTSVDFSSDFLIREFMYYYVADIVDLDETISECMPSKEAKAFMGVNYLDAYKMLVEEKINTVNCYKITQKNIENGLNLLPQHFKNFTDDNLYKRIFSYLYRYSEGNTIMPL
jgi:8-oxo-dGTP pyrophosphatase MutT (NUDIX family)